MQSQDVPKAAGQVNEASWVFCAKAQGINRQTRLALTSGAQEMAGPGDHSGGVAYGECFANRFCPTRKVSGILSIILGADCCLPT
jgi:hypothetical protein